MLREPGSCSEVTKSCIIIVQIVSYINNNSNSSNAIKILCKKAVVQNQICIYFLLKTKEMNLATH